MVNFQITNYDETIIETDYFETTQAKNNQSYLSLFMNYNKIYCRLLCADDEMIKKFKKSKVIKVIPELIGQQEYFYIAGVRKQLDNIELCAAVLVSFQNIDNYELFYYPNKKYRLHVYSRRGLEIKIDLNIDMIHKQTLKKH